MSLSRYFRDKGEFKPKSLVPELPGEEDNWQASTISSEETKEDPDISDPLDSLESEEEVSHQEPINSAPAQELPSQEHPAAASPPSDSVTYTPPSPMPDIESVQKEAYNAGVEQGLKQASADFGSTLTALTLLCDQLSTIRETILKNSKKEMVELVLALSEKIIRHSVTEQNQTIIDTVETAIQQAVKSSELYIYLHPDDMKSIQDRANNFISGVNGLENIIIKADPAIERGGCKIESDNCTVDATIISQFSVLKDSLRKKG